MSNTEAPAPAKARATPDVALILLALALLLAALAHWLPAGQFAVEMVNGKPRPVPGSYQVAPEWTGPPLFGSGDRPGLLNLLFEGLTSGSRQGSAIGIIAFLFVIGGAFGLVMHTGAIQRGLERLIARGSEHLWLLMPLLFVLFSLGGAVFGMGEEAVAFCLILAPLMVRLGYDSLCAVLVTYVATQIGFATSWMNPFSVAVAQGVSGLPVGSGAALRIAMWAVFTAFGLAWLLRYAASVKADPARSLTRAADLRHFPAPAAGAGPAAAPPLAWVDWAILAVLAATLVWVTWGVLAWGWYIPEIAGQFFTMGLACAGLAWLARRPGCSANALAEAFRRGMADMTPAVLVVALAKGMVLLLGGDNPAQPSVLNTLLHHIGQGLQGTPAALAAWGMLVLQSGINFFVPSGSGQAALVMPLLAPLSDLLGLTRQVAVLAFQLGDGLTNIIIPTSSTLVACLGAARVDWAVWLRFVWRLQLALFALASAFVLGAVALGYS